MASLLRRLQRDGLRPGDVVLLVALLLALCTLLVVGSQWLVDREPMVVVAGDGKSLAKEQIELAKLAAEVRQIRGDTSGGQFWLRLVALFVTVGGAIGGYLVAQDVARRARERLEDRRTIDALFQALVKELADPAPLLRAAAAVKLGELLHEFPAEWQVGEARRAELVNLAKRVLAAALTLEQDEKVQKTLSIAILRHRLVAGERPAGAKSKWDLRELDLSGAHARDAYWKAADLSGSDLYKADLTKASLRDAVLHYAQFREAVLREAVLAGADASGASFKLADLRGADLRGANLARADFDQALVHGARFDAAAASSAGAVEVDISPQGDGSARCLLADALARAVADTGIGSTADAGIRIG
ncbi:MAG: pentapeptide repeat-containing protein [Piscinibacter sp.]|nr:pentapeptide repeat-containing protein [Piscinibacter sp.]